MEIVKCSGCGKSYLGSGLIEVRDGEDWLRAGFWSDSGEVGMNISIKKDSLLVSSLMRTMPDGLGRYCVGCLGPVLILALGKSLNHVQVRAFHAHECDGGCERECEGECKT